MEMNPNRLEVRPEILRCDQFGHPHYDVRFGCPMCPRGAEKHAIELTKAQEIIKSWKEAWFAQRDATGKLAWKMFRRGSETSK